MGLEMLALIGVSDADLLQANGQLKRHLEKKMSKVYGGKEYTIISRGKKKHADETPVEIEDEDINEAPAQNSILRRY